MFALKMYPMSLADLSLLELVIQAQRHDSLAFKELMTRCTPQIKKQISTCYQTWEADYEEVEQEIYVRVWKGLPKLRNPVAFRGWLGRVIKNNFYDYLRQRAHQPLSAFSLDEVRDSDKPHTLFEAIDIRPRPDEAILNSDLEITIRDLVDDLPYVFREVMVLWLFEDCQYDEIAIRTNTCMGTVKSRVARGKQRLQQGLHAAGYGLSYESSSRI